MLTYTGRRNLFGTIVNISDTTTLTTADALLNVATRQVLTVKNWWFLEKAYTLTTVAATQFLTLPGQVDRILSKPYVTIGNIKYQADMSPSFDHWTEKNMFTYSSDIPEWAYLWQGQLGLFPIPSVGGYTVTMNTKQKPIDLSQADYTTGTITTTSTTGSPGVTTVTGSGTSWGASMIGRWIKIASAASDTAAHSGDDNWYQIASVPSATTLTLNGVYGGTALSGASCAYTIGQASILPEAYDHLPVWLALGVYFTSIDPNTEKANMYNGMATALQQMMNGEQSNRAGNRVLTRGIGEPRSRINPNNVIRT